MCTDFSNIHVISILNPNTRHYEQLLGNLKDPLHHQFRTRRILF